MNWETNVDEWIDIEKCDICKEKWTHAKQLATLIRGQDKDILFFICSQCVTKHKQFIIEPIGAITVQIKKENINNDTTI